MTSPPVVPAAPIPGPDATSRTAPAGSACADAATRAVRTILASHAETTPRSDAHDALFRRATRHIDIATRLTSLPPQWTVIESPAVELGEATAAFLIVGPAGLVAISTTGERTSDDDVARATSYRSALSRALEADVPVTTVHVASSESSRARTSDVRIDDLVEAITSLPEALTAAQTSAVMRFAVESFSSGDELTAAERLAFADVRRHRARATTRRRIWWAAAAVITLCVVTAALVLL